LLKLTRESFFGVLGGGEAAADKDAHEHKTKRKNSLRTAKRLRCLCD
jgi:hypothetical protein